MPTGAIVYEDFLEPGEQMEIPAELVKRPNVTRSWDQYEFDFQGVNTGVSRQYWGNYMGVEVYITPNAGSEIGIVTHVTVLGPGLGSGREMTVSPNGQMHKLDNIPIQDGAEYYLRYVNSGGNVHVRVVIYTWY